MAMLFKVTYERHFITIKELEGPPTLLEEPLLCCARNYIYVFRHDEVWRYNALTERWRRYEVRGDAWSYGIRIEPLVLCTISITHSFTEFRHYSLIHTDS
jgi:hypothetical protein